LPPLNNDSEVVLDLFENFHPAVSNTFRDLPDRLTFWTIWANVSLRPRYVILSQVSEPSFLVFFVLCFAPNNWKKTFR